MTTKIGTQILQATSDGRITQREGQVELPKSTNPYYPNEAPWYGVRTGRFDANGQPQYAFFSRGMAITNRPTVTQGGRTYALDKEVFRLGADFVRPNNAVASVKAGASRAGLPTWAMNDGVSLVHAPDNQAFLDAMLKQLGPELVRHMLADAQSYPELAKVKLGDIKNVRVDSVANYGQVEGRSGNGRRITISFELRTRNGAMKKLVADLSDPFFTDPLKGGQYGYVAPDGSFCGHQPVDNVRIVS